MLHQTLTAIAAATVLIAATATQAQEAPRTVQLGDYLGLRTVRATVGGQTGDFILDTGGGISVVSPALAEKAGCKPWAQIVGHRLSGERLTMPRCDGLTIQTEVGSLTSPSAGVFDLAALLPPDAPRIEGLIALDSLEAQPFTLELGAGRLTFETPETLAARIDGAIEVPIRFHRQAGGISLTTMVRVPTLQGDLWMQLDSGSMAPMLAAKSSAEPLGLDAEATTPQPMTLVLTGVNGDRIEAAAPVRVRDMIIDGNVGIAVMKTWVLTFDLANQKLWIRPVG